MTWRRAAAGTGALAIAAALLGMGAGSDVEAGRAEATAASLDVDPEEVERLRALGYVDVVAQDIAETPDGVGIHQAARVESGLNYFTNAYRCESRLISNAGDVLRTWRYEPCWKWVNSVLLPDGGVLALHYFPDDEGSAQSAAAARWLLRFDAETRLVWKRQLPVHHDVEVTPDGRIATLTYRHRRLPRVNRKHLVRDDYVTLLDADGALVEEFSIAGVLNAARDRYLFERVKIRKKNGQKEIDLLHTNSLEWMRDPELAARDPLYALTNVVVCMRHQNRVVVIDAEKKRLVWTWGFGELSGPHDASVLPNGNFLIFDNGLGRRWSRVIEVDPMSREIVWSYAAPEPKEFFTDQRGAAQRLGNGNTLVTNSQSGVAFEVTREGETVWNYRNPSRTADGRRTIIVRMRRVLEAAGEGAQYSRSD